MNEFRSAEDRESPFTPIESAEHKAGIDDLERQAQNRSEFTELYQRAKRAGSPEAQIELLRILDKKIRDVVTPGEVTLNTTNMSDQGLIDTYLGGTGQELWIGAGTMGQRIHFENHRPKPGTEYADLTTEDGRPGWMRYTSPSGPIGAEEWQHYADYFGAYDGYVQLAPDDEIKEEQW